MKQTSEYKYIYLGIDLGISGGIAVIHEKGALLDYYPMPKDAPKIISALQETLEEYTETSNMIIVPVMEHVASRPGEGVSSVFKFGYHSGGIYYMLFAEHLKSPESILQPQRISPLLWKKYFGLIAPEKSNYDKKKLSVDYVRASYGLPLKYSQNGIADAILIAEYLRNEPNKIILGD